MRERFKKDAEIRHRLEEVRIQAVGSKTADYDSKFDTERLVTEYRRIFLDYQIDVDASPNLDAVHTIQNSAIRQTLTAALDDFAEFSPDTALVRRLRQLTRSADPDPLRNEVRDALAQSDRGRLMRIARKPDVEHFEKVTLERVGGRF